MEHKLEYLMYKKREQKKARMGRSETAEDMERLKAKKFSVVYIKQKECDNEFINQKNNNS